MGELHFLSGDHLKRRDFLKKGAVACGGIAFTAPFPVFSGTAPAVGNTPDELTISAVIVQRAGGRRKTPVAPNAYAEYRGYEVSEKILRIQTEQGLEGVTELYANPEKRKQALSRLIGKDPFSFFHWKDERVVGIRGEYRDFVDELYGADIALFDLMAKAMRRPVTDLLGTRVRESVDVYDSSLYMEDLIPPEKREGLVYLDGNWPDDPVEAVVRKAEWITRQARGIKIFKVKVGRSKWMESFDKAMARDIEVILALRESLGEEYTLFVDGNDGYDEKPVAVKTFLSETDSADVYAMEEMFDHRKIDEYIQIKRLLIDSGMQTNLADGEIRGIPDESLSVRVRKPDGDGPLFDINQPDMNWMGYMRMKRIADRSRKYGVNIAPHNFGSEIGVYVQVHIALVTPNWEFCEADDSEFPAYRAPGVEIRDGKASLTGAPGLGVELETGELGEVIYRLS